MRFFLYGDAIYGYWFFSDQNKEGLYAPGVDSYQTKIQKSQYSLSQCKNRSDFTEVSYEQLKSLLKGT